MMSSYVAEGRKLTKFYKDFCALDHIDISVRQGEIYGLIGDNGAGKTTFLKLLAGQIFATEGEVFLFGQNGRRELEQQRTRVGTLIESAGFYPELSVEKNLEYFRIQKGIPGKGAVDEMLELVNLTAARKKAAKSLSLGMKQRLGLAIALLGSPELLLLDEPINGLDPSGIIEMRRLLLRLNQEKNITIILSSHILNELEQLATTYGFLQNGKLLEQVSGAQLHRRCADYIIVRVSDTQKYVICLEQKLHHMDYQIMPDDSIHILNPKENLDVYSRLAGEAGIAITQFMRCEKSLEEYYMDLKNGGTGSC